MKLKINKLVYISHMIKTSIYCILILLSTQSLFAIQKDSISFQATTPDVLLNVPKLAEYLTASLETDEDRAYHIFYWVAHNIKWDVRTYNKVTKIKYRTPEQVLKEKIAYPQDYANLYKVLCESIGIKAQVINGYERNELYNEGIHFYEPNHAWNAILVNKKWQLVDPCNAAGYMVMNLNGVKKIKQKINKKKLYHSTKAKFKFSFDKTLFLPDVEDFRINCLPVDPIWQLTDSAMPLVIFENNKEGIEEFNTKYSNPKQDLLKLSEVNRLNENEAILEGADRYYAFNNRYLGAKSLKHFALASTKVGLLHEAFTDKDALLLLGDAKNEIATSKEILTTQKKQIKNQTNELQKNNVEKRTDVIKFKKTFLTLNTKYSSEAKTKLSAAKSKVKALQSENHLKQKKLNEVNNNKDEKTNKNLGSLKEEQVETKKITDSLTARNQRKLNAENSLLTLKLLQKANLESQDQAMFELKKYMKLCDSALTKEAIARSKKQDSYSDSVKILRSKLYYYKVDKMDSLQNKYFNLYDDIVKAYDSIGKNYLIQQEIAKANATDYKQLLKMKETQSNYNQTYTECIEQSNTLQQAYISNLKESANYLSMQQLPLSFYTRKYKNENDFFNLLVKNEDNRKKQYKNLIKKKESLAKKHTQQRLSEIETLKKKLNADFNKLKKTL